MKIHMGAIDISTSEQKHKVFEGKRRKPPIFMRDHHESSSEFCPPKKNKGVVGESL